MHNHSAPALLLIDIQQGFSDIAYWGGHRNNPGAEQNAARLLQEWRRLGRPVIHVQHASTNPVSRLHPSHPGHAIQEIVKPEGEEPVFKKQVNSAFIGTTLEDWLKQRGIDTLVLAGLTTDHCVSTTARMAGNLGFQVYVVHDATATFSKKGFDGKEYPAELVHETALASLHGEFATVMPLAGILKTFS